MKVLGYIIALVATLALWCLIFAAGYLWGHWITVAGLLAWGMVYWSTSLPWKPKGRWK